MASWGSLPVIIEGAHALTNVCHVQNATIFFADELSKYVLIEAKNQPSFGLTSKGKCRTKIWLPLYVTEIDNKYHSRAHLGSYVCYRAWAS